MQTQLLKAIATRHLVQLDYNGSTRIVEPHIYGIDTRGHETLSAYQVAGGSLSGEGTGWKTFEIARAEDIRLLASHFTKPRREYNPGDAKFRTVYTKL